MTFSRSPARLRRLAIAAPVLFAAAAPAAAQEVLGTIAGTLGGEAREWYVTASDEGSQSDWSGSDTWATVSLMGHAAADTTFRTREALSIGFTLTERAGATDPEVSYFVEGISKAYVGNPDETGLTITVDDYAFAEGVLTLSGTVTGTLAYSEDFGRSLDQGDTVEIDVAFETAVRELQ